MRTSFMQRTAGLALGLGSGPGGSLQMGGTAHIMIGTIAPPLMADYFTSAVVDPDHTIAERNEANNVSGLTLEVVPLN
jgi:hypothetical protein